MRIYSEPNATTRYYFDCILEDKYTKKVYIECKGGFKKALKILLNYKKKVTQYNFDMKYRI